MILSDTLALAIITSLFIATGIYVHLILYRAKIKQIEILTNILEKLEKVLRDG